MRRADCAVGSPYDVAGGWEVVMTWQKVYLGRATVRASGKSAHWRCSYSLRPSINILFCHFIVSINTFSIPLEIKRFFYCPIKNETFP